ncbi:MAG: ABC transporter ATP-binding protein [Eubacteriales bacterium]|nr:ABC transporter ATP-binding protein [Eubacteriales bacterium]
MLSILKKLNQLFEKRKKIILIGILILTLFSSILESVSLALLVPISSVLLKTSDGRDNIIIKIFDNFFHFKSTYEITLFLIIFFVLLNIFKGVYKIFVCGVQNKFIYNTKAQIQRKIIQNTIFKPYSYFQSISSSEMLRTTTDDVNRTFDLISSLNNFLTEFITFLVLVITGLYINFYITLFFGIFLLLDIIITNKILRPYLYKCGVKIQKHMGLLLKWVNQIFLGIKDVKINTKEEYFLENFNESAVMSAYYYKRNSVLVQSVGVLLEEVVIFVVGIFLFFALKMNINILENIPGLVGLGAIGVKILQCANRFSSYYASLNVYVPSLDIVNQVISNMKDKIIFEENKNILPFKNKLEMQNVSFKYNTNSDYVIKNANMEVPHGKTVGIIGVSGGGKTTSVDLLLGLLIPNVGEILVDNINIKNKEREWLQNISYVPQNIFLLDDTIKKNVAFGIKEKEIDEERVISSLKEASLYDFVKTLKSGIEEEVGENGIRISGGQRQRVGIARALYKNPNMIVFDEATSALDNDTEKEIMQTINALHKSRTIIIIAHRLTTIENCDIVYKVENKKIERIK